MTDWTDLEQLATEYQEEETQNHYKPYTRSMDSDNTLMVIETPEYDYEIEYRLLRNATRPKKVSEKIRLQPINAVDCAFILTLHNFSDERYNDFFKARRTHKIDTIYALPDDTPDHGQEFITVEVTHQGV